MILSFYYQIDKRMYTYMEIVFFYFQIECPSNWP